MPEIGDSLGRYTLLKRLAQGGMGEVFLAAKPGPVGFGPRVALKILHEQFASDQTFIDMLVDEANISMFLNHQNVVSVLDLAEERGTYYIAMEYVQGLNLEGLLDRLNARSYKLDVPTSLYVATELCRALKYAHTRVNHTGEPLNIVHRDVTPANILISTQGEVKLTDFGIARAKGRIHQTQAGVLKGKFGYMAPEMIRYEQIDARVDLFCAGCVLYLMTAGRHPVAGASVMEAIQRYEDKQIPRPSTICAEIPPQLDDVIMRCLEPQPDARWPSAAALANALQEVVLGHPTWRREVQDGAQRLSGMMRAIAPEIFVDPVPPEVASELLSKALGTPFSPPFKPAAPPVDPLADTQEPAAPTPPARRGSVVAHGPGSAASAGPGFPAAERPTEESPVARASGAACPEVHDTPELATEESIALSEMLDPQAQAARESRPDPSGAPVPRVVSLKKSGAGERRELKPDTGDLPPRSESKASPTLPSTAALDRASPFDEPAKSSRDLREDLLEEPALPVSPGAAQGGAPSEFDWEGRPRLGGAAAAMSRPLSDDGRTIVALSMPADSLPAEPSVDDDEGGRTLAATSALLEPELPALPEGSSAGEFDDGKTMLGMSMADVAAGLARATNPDIDDALDSTKAYASVDVPRSAAVAADGLETLIPLPKGSDMASGMGGADPTLLDGVDSRAVAEALAAQKKARTQDLPKSAAAEAQKKPRTQDLPKSAGLHGGELDMDRIVAESVVTGAQKAIGREPPRPAAAFSPAVPLSAAVPLPGSKAGASQDLPSKVVAGTPQAASAEPAKSAAGAADARRKVPQGLRERNRAPGEASSDLPHGAAAPQAMPVGPKTGKWMAGQLEPGQLEWGDDAAARRAVATRNAGRPVHATTPAPGGGPVAPTGTPHPAPASNPGAFGHPGILPPASVSSGVRYPPGTFIGPDGRPVVPSMVPASALSRNWTVIVMLVAASVAVVAVAGVMFFTKLLWPKLRLESDPPGAHVAVDGQDLPDLAPLVVQVEPERPHSIELKLEGFKPERREITDGVARGRTYALEVRLVRIIPLIDLGPVSGRVLVNGKDAGSGNRVQLGDLPLDAPVRIRVEAEGYQSWERAFDRGSLVPEVIDVPMSR